MTQSALSLDEFLILANTAKRVAIHREVQADRLTPINIVESLSNEMIDGSILESGFCYPNSGRYSFITFGSMAKLSVKNNIVTQFRGENITTHTAHPLTIFRQLLASLSYVGKNETPHLLHGAIGFVTYDAIRLFESISDRHAADHALPDMLFNFYQTTLMFDHLQHKLIISIIVEIGENPTQDYDATQKKITALINKITTQTHHLVTTKSDKQPIVTINADITDIQFAQLVERAKEYIVKGEVFQIVLSRCFKQPYTANPFDIYRALRKIHPALYMFYLSIEDSVMIGASPEKLISVCNRQVEINPIAGTHPRLTKNQDEKIANDLLTNEKEVAEHIMLVDLARNDLGAVCVPGSIQVRDLLQVKHFSHVSHLTSTVTGELRDDMDALDAFVAAFPAGTLSGAPKIRAMQLIDELETSKRGIYGGAICRLDYQGNLDSCIAIRMAILKEGIATVRAGAGIVYDSDPLSETNETRQKAQGILEAIALAEGRVA